MGVGQVTRYTDNGGVGVPWAERRLERLTEMVKKVLLCCSFPLKNKSIHDGVPYFINS